MDNSRAYIDRRRNIWELLNRSNVVLTKYADMRLLKEIGISYKQFMVLYILDRIGVTATVTQIAGLLDRNPNTLSTILDRMEKSGLVKKIRDKKDRRLVNVVMMQKGKNKLTKAMELGWAMLEKLSSPFSEEELQTYTLLTEKLLKEANELLVPRKVVKLVNTRRVQSTQKTSID